MMRSISDHINLVISTDEKYKILSDGISSKKIHTSNSKIIKNTSLQVELYKPGNINNYAYLALEYMPNNSDSLDIQVNINSQLSSNKKDNIFQLNNVFWGILNGNDRYNISYY